MKNIISLLSQKTTYFYFALGLTLLNSIPYFYRFTEPMLTISLVWGGMLIALDLLKKRVLFQTLPSRLACLFVFVMGVSALCSGSAVLIDNIKVLAYNCIPLLLLFPFDKAQEPLQVEGLLKNICRIFVIFTFLITSISDLMFLFWIHVPITVNGKVVELGVTADRLAGIYNNPIDGSIFAFLSILLCLYLWQDKQDSRRFRLFTIVNIILQGIFLAASDSSGPIIALAGTAACAFLLFYSPRLYRKIKKLPVTVVISFVVCLCFLPVTLFLFTISKNGLSLLPASVQYMQSQLFIQHEKDRPDQPDPPFNQIFQEIQIGRTYDENYQSGQVGSANDFTSGRLYLWKASLSYFSQNPILGIGGKPIISQGELASRLDKEALSPDYLARIIRMNGSTHNMFLQILLGYGVIGFLCFIAVGLAALIPILKCLPRLYGDFKHYRKYSYLLLSCVFILLTNFVENYILCRQSHIEMYLFWTFAGALVYFAHRVVKE